MKFSDSIRIDESIISKESPVFIIAEAGVNHNGDMNLAKKMIDTAADAGVDAIKFQAFRTEHLILNSVTKAPYQKGTTDNTESQFEMLKKLEVSIEENLRLVEYCKLKGITYLTTPFDEVSLEELDNIDLPAYKISSTDLTNLPFINKIANKQKPIILSTGMSKMEEIKMALEEIHPLNDQVILLQCTSNYPVPEKEVNLNVLNTFRTSFDIILGFSDHTAGIGASPYAIPLGAKLIEKHFTLDKKMPGPDHRASLNPEELKNLVIAIRTVEKYMGSWIKEPSGSEIQTRISLQKCLVAKENIEKGELIRLDQIVAKRTGGIGISPTRYKDIIGKIASKNYHPDDIIEE